MSTSRPAGRRYAAIWWIAVLGWMAVIFFFSSQPDADSSGGEELHIGAYKGAHLVVFGVLGVLVAGATRHLSTTRASWWAWVTVVIYAISDEIHQAFVPGRSPLVMDVAIDSVGGLIGILAFERPHSIQVRGVWRRAHVLARGPAKSGEKTR